MEKILNGKSHQAKTAKLVPKVLNLYNLSSEFFEDCQFNSLNKKKYLQDKELSRLY